MQYHLTSTYFISQEAWIANHGDRFWGIMCDELDQETAFTRLDVQVLIETAMCYSNSSAYKRACALVANLVAMPDGGLVKVSEWQVRFHGE